MRRPRLVSRLFPRLGLRARITLAFAVGALFLSVVLAGATLGLTRQNLLDQRESSATARTYQNAASAELQLPATTEGDDTPSADPTDAARVAPDADRLEPVLVVGDRWYARAPEFGEEVLPGVAARRRCVRASRPSCGSTTRARPSSPWASRSSRSTAPTSRSCPSASSRRRSSRSASRCSPPPLLSTLAGAARRLVGVTAGAAPAAGHRRRRPRHRHGPPRHPRRGQRRRRPRPPRRLVQRDGVGARGAHPARRPVRLQRQPRAAVAADDAGRLDRGAAEPARRHAATERGPRST